MTRSTGLRRQLVATCVILMVPAVIVPAAVQGHPVQNRIILTSPANGAPFVGGGGIGSRPALGGSGVPVAGRSGFGGTGDWIPTARP
jgi:hypothetical protein